MLERKKDYHGWLYLAIPLILLTIFTFFPLFKTAVVSFDNGYNKWQDAFSFAFSLKSYQLVLSNPTFLTTLKNTLIIVFVSVPISTILGLLIAVGLNSIKPLQKLLQTIFFMPYVTNTIAIGMVFAVIFNVNTGLLNSMLDLIGIDPQNWVNRPFNGLTATYFNKMFALQVYTIWSSLPFKILIFLGGLQNIGKQYYDAARIDATPKHRVFTRITLPLLSPIISYVLITSFIGAFKTYDSVVGLFGSNWGATKEIQTVVGYVYQQLAESTVDSYSKGAAAAVILFGIIMVFTAINLFISKRNEHY